MRRITRTSVAVIALATAGAVGVAGYALAAASSTVPVFSFAPNTGVGSIYKPGKLSIRTHTTYTASTQTSRLQLYFDDDLLFNPGGFPKCDPAGLGGDLTMRQALQRCGPAAGAAKNAWLWPATSTTSNGTVRACCVDAQPINGCVLLFNGTNVGPFPTVVLFIRVAAVGPINCGNPANNSDGDRTLVLNPLLRPNPSTLGNDYAGPGPVGRYLDLTNLNTSGIPLTDLSLAVQRGTYIRARCVDPPTPPAPNKRRWNLRAVFTYVNPSATQTVSKSQACT